MIDLSYKIAEGVYNINSTSTQSNPFEDRLLLWGVVLCGIEAGFLFYFWYNNKMEIEREEKEKRKEEEKAKELERRLFN